MMKCTLNVAGMMCEHCEKRVTSALSQLPGMQNVQADAKANTVVCEFDKSQTNIDQIRTAIEEVGYDVVEG